MGTTFTAPPPQLSARKEFPARGFWCIVDEHLGIIAALGKWSIVEQTEPDPAKPGKMRTVKRDSIAPEAPFAEVHLVDTAEGETHGETTKILRNVPFDQLRVATLDEIKLVARASHVTAGDAMRMGYMLTDEQIASVPPLERRRHGLALTSDENAAADAAHRAELDEAAVQAKIAEHPDAVALEDEIARESAEFIAKVAARRQEVADRIRGESAK